MWGRAPSPVQAKAKLGRMQPRALAPHLGFWVAQRFSAAIRTTWDDWRL